MKTLLAFLFIITSSLAIAQEAIIPVRFISAVKELPERYEGKDTFDWEYTITNNTLRKQKDGKFVEYKNLSLGDIHRTDIQNPLQVVIFYKNFNTAVLLDNQFNEAARINFSDIPEPVIVEATGLASQNRLWVFDINTQQLGLYNPSGMEYKPLTPPFTDSIKYYQSDYNYFYWIDSKNQCFVSDIFGKVKYLGNVPDFEQVQIASLNYVIIKQENKLHLFNFRTGTSIPVQIVENSFKGFHFAAQILSIFTEREINQYKITLPE